MLLNNLSYQFCIYFDVNTFYPTIERVWLPVLKKMSIPYMSVEDFINSQIQTFNFPGVNSNNVSQQIGLYNVKKRPGFQMDQLMQKEFSISFKLTESYITYFIMRQQYEMFLKLIEVQELYFAPISVSLLDSEGNETISYKYHQVTPKSISALDLNYVTKLADFHTFDMSFDYNYFDIWYRTEDGKKILIDSNRIDSYLKNN